MTTIEETTTSYHNLAVAKEILRVKETKHLVVIHGSSKLPTQCAAAADRANRVLHKRHSGHPWKKSAMRPQLDNATESLAPKVFRDNLI